MNSKKHTTTWKLSRIKRHMARGLAFIMCLILLVTSVDITAFAVTDDYLGNSETKTAEYTAEPVGQNESAEEDVESGENEEISDAADDETTSESVKDIESEEGEEETGEVSDASEDVSDDIDEENSEDIDEEGEPELSDEKDTEDDEEEAKDSEAKDKEVKEEKSEKLEETVTVDDVMITVSADEGVFPNGSKVSVRKVSRSEEKEVNEAIDEVRDDEKNVALSYTFDIKVCDEDGNEIEPDTEKGSVKVSFKMTEIANTNLETDVYHVEETDKGLNAENLDVDTESTDEESDEITVETYGFSYYTVEFTYGELQYVLEGDERVELSTVLNTVGIKENGEISKVEGSNDELFKPVKEDDVWYIEAVKAFSSEEWLKVTIDGIEYEIVVTDDQDPGEWTKLLNALKGDITSTEAGQFEIDGSKITLLTDFTAKAGDGSLDVYGTRTLDLNGHIINANGINRCITVQSGANLTLEDSDTTASHEGYVDEEGIWHLGTGTGTSTPIIGGLITGGNVNIAGGGVKVLGSLIMNGGSICGNKASYTDYQYGGGGVAVDSAGEFEMHGGKVMYNKAGNGGGVWVMNSTFNMYEDAVISDCKATASGGGVFVQQGPFNMYGGTIEKCATVQGDYGDGGGVYTHTSATFTMTGGEIKKNTAARRGGGVYNGLGTITLGGNAKIDGNFDVTTYDDLYLPLNHTVQISTTTHPIKGMSVRVTLENGTGKVTGTSGTDQYAQYFSSDNLSYGVVAKSGLVQIVSKDSVVACVNHNDQLIYYDSLQNAINAAGTEDEVQLLHDIQEDISVSADRNITLDLNGRVLKGKGDKSTITISSGATVTLCDSRADVDHYYKYNAVGPWVWDDSTTDGAKTVDEITDSTTANTPIILKGGAITGGIGSYNQSGTEGGGIYNAGTLIMEGGNIVGNSAGWHGGGIHSKDTFELKNGNIVGNYSGTHGAGVFIDGASSKFVMNGGKIINNYANAQAGGVYLANGSFDLNSGIISYNRAYTFAGGVSASGIMKMYGGEISYNKTVRTDTFAYGGGIHNQNELYIYGGYIKNNSARYGGGIYNGYIDNGYNNPGYLTMIGGTVAENNCSLDGGGAYFRNGSITVGGKAQISGNKKGTGQDASEQNIYLPSGLQIEVADGDDVPASGMEIGVTMASGTGYFTTDTATEDCEAYFFADDSEKSTVYDPSKKQMLLVNGEPQVHDNIVFVDWKETTSLPTTAGNYYLTNDVTLSNPWSVPAGTTNLCLNGHVIKQGASCRVIYVPTTATLNIYDCSSEKHYFTRSSEAEPWVLAEDQTTPTELFVEGGVITGGVITGIESGAGIFVDGTFSLYGGNIVGNRITNATADKVFGAGVFVQKTGVFNMHGGSIVGNACNANAGGVAVGGNGNPTGKFNMYGGIISDNYASLWGGGANNWGTIVMKGGTITNNIAKTYGGGGVSNATAFTMTGGTIKDNNANTAGGGVVGDGTVTIGGTAVITDNYVKESADNLSLSGSMYFASGEDAPTIGMNVGVTTRAASVPVAISVANDTDYSEYFTSDNSEYSIYYKSDKKLYLALSSTVTIDLKGGSYPEGSSAVTDWTYDSGEKTYSKKGSKVTLPGEPIPPAYMVFKGWKYNSNVYEAGTEIVFENTENRTYTAEYENIGSSIKTFATTTDLKNPDCFTLWQTGNSPKGVAQKVYFGGMPWYIVGEDNADGSLVLMSAPDNFDNSKFGNSNAYSDSTVRDYLNTTALDQFTTAEKNLMESVAGAGIPAEGDKLYLGTGANLQQGVAVGINNVIYVSVIGTYASPGSPYTSGNLFWLRTPYGVMN